MMKGIKQKLLYIGLSDKEVDVYLALLQFGRHPTSFIAKKAGLNRGTAFNMLHALLQRGLVVKSSINGVQHFSALSPEQLLNHIERREEELQDKKLVARELIAELEAISPRSITKPSVRHFSGVDGVRAALNDTLEAKDKMLRAYTSSAEMIGFLGDYFGGEYTNERVRRGYSLQSIQNIGTDKDILPPDRYRSEFGHCPERRREVRYTRAELAFPIELAHN